jgi:hypothetical protein
MTARADLRILGVAQPTSPQRFASLQRRYGGLGAAVTTAVPAVQHLDLGL